MKIISQIIWAQMASVAIVNGKIATVYQTLLCILIVDIYYNAYSILIVGSDKALVSICSIIPQNATFRIWVFRWFKWLRRGLQKLID